MLWKHQLAVMGKPTETRIQICCTREDGLVPAILHCAFKCNTECTSGLQHIRSALNTAHSALTAGEQPFKPEDGILPCTKSQSEILLFRTSITNNTNFEAKFSLGATCGTRFPWCNLRNQEPLVVSHGSSPNQDTLQHRPLHFFSALFS